MTAPDPGLTDLIAAHHPSGHYMATNEIRCGCGWLGPASDWPAHVALVVEQHTNMRIAELEAELEKQKRGGRTIGKAIDRTLKWVIEASNSEDLIGDDGDGDWEIVWDRLFQLRPKLEAATARAEKAEATIARVEKLAAEYARDDQEHLNTFGQHHPVAGIAHDHLRAALEGEQR